jgi:N-acetyl-gamma-glutamyl-phosphate reductase
MACPSCTTPGCYPTASMLALAPLARAGLIDDLVIDAKQGLSGAGRSATWQTHFSNSGENILPYNIVHHRHTPEIEEQLSALGVDLRVQFTPHLVPLDQGELVNCYVTPTRAVEFVELTSKPAEVRDVRETNICRLHVVVSAHTGKIVVLSAIDNLWKGTSSQAIQNMNLMFGFPETEGLL